MSTVTDRTQPTRWLPATIIGIVLLMTGYGHAEEPVKPLPAKADFHVAPNGKDSSPGTAAAPFASLARARDAVRAKVAAGLTGNVLVLIEGGVYSLTETLTFGPDDSGAEQHSITYAAAPGETVVLSGGSKIAGWRKNAGEIWTAEIPEVKAGNWSFRQLFVDGNRALRARTPNADSAEPWCKMLSSTAKEEEEDKPITVKLGGFKQPFQVTAYKNPGDVELVYICNNDMGRKRLGTVNEKDQTFTLAPPHRWNSKQHGNDWSLSFPEPRSKSCYLENALEMLDKPGEWYLDRSTGVVSYWPRPGEDMAKVEVVAPVAHKTLLAVIGTRAKPVSNLHFKGIHVEHVDWVPPEWGYMGLFCCTIDTGPKDRLQHGFLDAAVEFEHARGCNFTDGGIAHSGGMGLCLRRGTAGNIIEGNEIGDLGAGGIGVSEIRQQPIGQRSWNPMPEADDYKSYRIANNYLHHCGTDYFGAVGITLFMMQDSVIAHNLIHDTAYSGIQWAGDCPGQSAFTRNNTVEFNHIHDTMRVTVDGAGMYVCYAHAGQTIIRGNVIHDTRGNRFARGDSQEIPPSAGLYLDSAMKGGRYENNVLYRNLAAGPLIFNYDGAQEKNHWVDNTIATGGIPPAEFLDAVQALAGPEPAYQTKLFKTEPKQCELRVLADITDDASWGAYQYHLPRENRGVVQIIRRGSDQGETLRLKMPGLIPADDYSLKVVTGTVANTNVWGPGAMPMLTAVEPTDGAPLGVAAQASGRNLQEAGLTVTLPATRQMMWIIYGKQP